MAGERSGIKPKKLMAMLRTRKGFTLIEILTVVAIIAILASIILVGLSSARTSARDARRIADLDQIRTAMELYFNKVGHYPTDCSAVNANSVTWSTIQGDLTGAGIGVTTVADDPLANPASPQTSVHYGYSPTTTGGYDLSAVLEVSGNSALNTSIKGNPPPNAPANCSLSCNGQNYCIGM